MKVDGIVCDDLLLTKNAGEQQIEFTSPRMDVSGFKSVEVINVDGTFELKQDFLLYSEATKPKVKFGKAKVVPIILDINPSICPLSGTMVQINAKNISNGALVKVGNVFCNEVSVILSKGQDKSSRIVFQAPPFDSEGKRPVTIINPDQSSATFQSLQYTNKF